ncbi:MAG: thiamine pyrophosphate-dependent enzyme [Egibacteraceae bacterium]
MSWRGDPEGSPDEPQHRVIGAATARILDELGVRHWRLPSTAGALAEVLDQVDREHRDGRSAVILVPKGGIGPWTGDARRTDAGGLPIDPVTAVRAIQEALTDELVVSTTGYLSRRLFACGDRPGTFYMQGSMGHAVSIALGAAVARPRRRVVVLDGDGACLMHMGALSTVGAVAPPNITHMIVDNGCYASTGGQPTTSSTTRLDDVASASGYRFVAGCETPDRLPHAVRQALDARGPALLLIRTGVDASPPPPRPTSSLEPGALRARFELMARG